VKDHTLPSGKWKFDQEVTTVFDDMLQRSIPQYSIMRDIVFDVGSSFVRPGCRIIDLGCSRGESLARFAKQFRGSCSIIGVDVSGPMIDSAKDRFRNLDFVEIQECDLRYIFPEGPAELILSILTLQFIPIEYRQGIVQKIFNCLKVGGGFILVEKILGATALLDRIMINEYLKMKSENGYTQEEIERKKLSLEGVLVPVTASWNEELLKMAGFRQVDCIWRWLNFAGWVAIKD